jgi:hypothetical protein
MSSVSNFTNGSPRPGLPPVAPPTAAFLARLFLVPALIVAVLVGVAFLFHLSFGWLFGSPRTPEQFLAKLDDTNAEVRWRAAGDLSQVLLRDDRLASNADFALELVKRLKQARADSKAAELEVAQKFPALSVEELDKMSDEQWLKRAEDLQRESIKLDAERTYIKFLTASLGNFMVPVGVPELRDIALQEGGVEASQLAERRANALWALAVLGENCKRFDKLPAVEQQMVFDALEGALNNPERADGAGPALTYLRKRQEKLPDAMGMDLIAERTAQADDPFLRELSAFALNFWNGDDAANKRMEKTLAKLAHDDGRGTLSVEQLRTRTRRMNLLSDRLPALWSKQTVTKTPTIAYTNPPDLNIILNATTALARRGSDEVSTGRLAEMLDVDKLRTRLLREDLQAAKPEPDEGLVVQTVVTALNAVAELHKKRPEKITPALRAAVDKLKGNGNAAVKKVAEETALAIGSGQ